MGVAYKSRGSFRSVVRTAASVQATGGARRIDAAVSSDPPLHLGPRSLAEMERIVRTLREENDALQAEIAHGGRLAVAGELAARMAHEIRNPLGSIALFAALLRDHPLATPDERAGWAAHISTAVGAMNDSLSNLLGFSGRPAPRFHPIDLAQVIDEARDLSAHLLARNNVRFVRSTETLPAAIWGDEHLLRSILTNLISNAADAMPNGGTLEVTATPHLREGEPEGAGARHALLTVADTGCGISPDLLSKIFDPFFTTKGKGTGLGLAVVRNAVSAYGGTIQVDSVPGRGTTVALVLPASEAVGSVSLDV